MQEHSGVEVDTLAKPEEEDKDKFSDCIGPAVALVHSQDPPLEALATGNKI